MNCPGSVALIGDESSETNQAAMLGTAAHKVIQVMLEGGQHEAAVYHNYIVRVKAAGDEDSVVFPSGHPGAMEPADGWFAFIVDDTMVNGVQCTIDAIDRAVEEMYQPEVIAERYLDMTWLDPRLGGTADCTLVEFMGWAHLFDHKNGRVLVEVNDNEQMKNYAVGVLHEHPDCEGVHVSISQPNAAHEDGPVRKVSYTRAEIEQFEIDIKEAALATDAPNAPLRAGDWCTYCPAKTRCTAFEALMMSEAAEDFGFDPVDGPMPETLDAVSPTDTPTVDTDNIAALVRKSKLIPLFDQWARDIKAAIQHHLVNGTPVPGKKLVHGKSNRTFKDTTAVEQRVNADVPGFPLTELWDEPKFKGPAKLEKLGRDKNERKLMKAIVADLAFKPPGKLSVADENDPRPAVDVGEEAILEFDDGETVSGVAE
jgi:hypothetical protein